MKTKFGNFTGIVTCLLLLTVFFSCSDNNSEVTIKWDTFEGHIDQTYWEGTLTEINEGNVYKTSSIKMVFFDQQDGGNYTINEDVASFQYSYKGKVMDISNISNIQGTHYSLSGKWWILSFSPERLQIRDNISNDAYYKILDLKRAY